MADKKKKQGRPATKPVEKRKAYYVLVKVHNSMNNTNNNVLISRDTIPEIKVLFDAWLSEDGGRLYKKRNRGILIEIPESTNLELPNDNFCWVSLFQIKQLLSEDGWINPHIRGILSHV